VPYRVAGELKNTDFVMESVFWIGLYPGLSAAMLDYVIDSLITAVQAEEICGIR
jgi:CDP-6-deoxy-D-xylo-4-hexulose-3-dehydrase